MATRETKTKKKKSFVEMLKERGLRETTLEEDTRDIQIEERRIRQRKRRKPFWRKKYPKGERYWMPI